MTRFHKSATSTLALCLCLNGTAALADLSAQDVWADWQSYMQGFGYNLTGTEAMSGDTLTVSDLNMTMALPEDAGSMTMTLSQFAFTDNGDGTVTMTLPETQPIRVSVDSTQEEDVDMVLDLDTTNFAMVASGDPENLSYAYGADSVGMTLTELVVDDKPVEIGAAQVVVAMLDGSSVVKGGELRDITQKMQTGAVSYLLDFDDPEGSGRMNIEGKADSMSFDGSGSYPDAMDTDDVNAMLDAGFAFDGSFRHEGGSTSLDVTEDGEEMQFRSSSESGGFRVAMDSNRMAYDITSDNAKVMLVGGEVPFPVELAMARTAFNLLMPVGQSDVEQPFGLGFTLADFTMSDMIWSMFDPGGQLPRDPATLSIDLTGTAKLFFDLLDAEQLEGAGSGEEMPGELNSLKLNDLKVSVAGADLSGTGAFTFDNSDLETYDGLPAPDGSVNLSLVGANGLIDRLIAMGLLPEEQAMGARMMMGLFAVPGEGEDTLTSTIEVKPNGQILANGQRLQ